MIVSAEGWDEGSCSSFFYMYYASGLVALMPSSLCVSSDVKTNESLHL